MSKLGDFLKDSISKMMEFHKRSASGESVETLREEYRDGRFLIWGVDYWDEINNGVPAGTLVPLADLQSWSNAKSSRYSITLPPATAIQRRIYAKGSSTPTEKLQIINQVTTQNSTAITEMAQDFVFELLKIK